MNMLHKKVRVDVVSYMLSVSDERGYWHSESREGNYSECISPRYGEVWCKPWKYAATTSCITSQEPTFKVTGGGQNSQKLNVHTDSQNASWADTAPYLS